MSDDSDLLIAAAATAAVFTWMGTRQRRRSAAAARRRGRALLQAMRAGLARSWRETPLCLLITGIRDALSRKR